MRHEEEIFSLSWQPEGEWDTCGKVAEVKKPLFVSSIASPKQPSIRVWDRTGVDVKILHPWDKEMRTEKLSKSFVPSQWGRDPKTGKVVLFTCGKSGEILSYSDTVKDEVHSLHTNYTIFGLVQCGDILWSLSYEPFIVGWNLRTEEPELLISAFRGICTIQASPMDSSRVGIGGGDNMIRVVKMGNPDYPELKPMEIEAPICSKRVTGRITAVRQQPYSKNS
jgi:hypothetical protein